MAALLLFLPLFVLMHFDEMKNGRACFKRPANPYI
jgi:hypothetical protein